jgi:hypothetical protein
MDGIVIDRIRATFQGGLGVLTAELAPSPTGRWREVCETCLDRYSEAFGGAPALVADAIVVSTTPRDLATSEMALRQVVRVTNLHDSHEPVDRP